MRNNQNHDGLDALRENVINHRRRLGSLLQSLVNPVDPIKPNPPIVTALSRSPQLMAKPLVLPPGSGWLIIAGGLSTGLLLVTAIRIIRTNSASKTSTSWSKRFDGLSGVISPSTRKGLPNFQEMLVQGIALPIGVALAQRAYSYISAELLASRNDVETAAKT